MLRKSRSCPERARPTAAARRGICPSLAIAMTKITRTETTPSRPQPSDWLRGAAEPSAVASTRRDLEDLAPLIQRAPADLAALEGAERWSPTPYEVEVVPGLRLLGRPASDRETLISVADLHVHTQWSDGDDLDRVLEMAVARRLDALAITDHDEIEGALEARRRVHERRLPLSIIPGVEVSSRDGHIGALFVTQRIPKGLSAAETIGRIHEAGGLAIAHHPFTPRLLEWAVRQRLGVGRLAIELPFDAVEALNSTPGLGKGFNRRARKLLAKADRRIAWTASSDAHHAQFVGMGTTLFAGSRGVLSLRAAIENGHTRTREADWTFNLGLRYHGVLIWALLRNALIGRESVH